MTDNDLPYYFAEAFEPRNESTARERALGFDTPVREWLHTLRAPTAEARSSHERAMQVEKIWLTFAGRAALELAGAFLMTSTLNGYVVLYTPAFGIEYFASDTEAKQRLHERLAEPSLQQPLMAFVARSQRAPTLAWTRPDISCTPINGSVFKEVRDTIEANQRHNLQALQVELLKLPTLTTLLDLALQAELKPLFPGWNQSATRMLTYRAGPTREQQPVASHTLEQAVLGYFRRQQWPAEYRYQFIEPGSGPTTYTASASENQQWLTAITRLGTTLPNRLQDQLQHYWNVIVIEPYGSRLELFAQTLKDGYQVVLLKALEAGNIAARDYQWLKTLHVGTSLQADKLRLNSPGKPFMDLAGYLMLHNAERSNSPVFLYRAFDTLRVFPSIAQLQHYLLAPLDVQSVPTRLVDALALKERKDARSYTPRSIDTVRTGNSISLEMMQIFTDKQAHNLNQVIQLYKEHPRPFDLAAVIDAAIDVRHMITPQLMTFDTQGRWSTHLNLASLDDARQAESVRVETSLATKDIVTQQISELDQLHHSSQQALFHYPSLYSAVQTALSEALGNEALGHLKPSEVLLNRYSSAPSSRESRPALTSQDLVDHFIERMNGYAQPLLSPQNWGAYEKRVDGINPHIPNLSWSTLNRLMDTALHGFTTKYLEQHRDFYTGLIGTFKNTQLAALRNEMQIKARSHPLFSDKQNVLLRILDNPLQALRKGLNGFVPEVFGLSVTLHGQETPVDLHSAFLITEYGGLHPQHSGCALFWTPVAGLELASTLELATQCLNERLADPHLRELLQGMQGYPERLTPWQRHSTNTHSPPRIHYRPIQENFLDTLLHAQIGSLTRAVQHAIAQPLPAHQTQEWVNYSHINHRFHLNVQHTLNLAHDTLLQLAMPTWLTAVPAQGLLRLAHLIEKHHQLAEINQDFLNNDLPDLSVFAHTRLLAQVEADHPGHGVYLDHFEVQISPRQTVSDTTATPIKHSLTELMLLHADRLDNHHLRLINTKNIPAPAWLTVDYLKQLHQRLNIGQNFRAILQPRIATPQTPGTHEPCKLFSQHAPWQILGNALLLHLQGKLSSTALNLIEQLMEMPDDTARLPVNGHKAVLRPLHLRHTSGATPSLLQGMYWISREIAQGGPRVLLTLLNDTFSLKEYAHEDEFLNQLRHSDSLQSLVLQRLPEAVRAVFKAGHFLLTHLDAAGGSAHYMGNVLRKLYDDTTHMVMSFLGQQHALHGEQAWNIAKAMFEAAQRLGTVLLIGKQRLPVLAWQVLPQLVKAAKLAWQGEWKSAMSECAQILLQLALAKQSPVVQPALPTAVATALPGASIRPVSITSLLAQHEALSSWHNRTALTPAQEQRLRSYEIKDVELSELQLNVATGLYTDPATNLLYAPVQGKVFQVEQDAQRWRIVGGTEKGPYLLKDPRQHWQVNLKGYLHGGGSRLGHVLAPLDIKIEIYSSLNIEAAGMQSIHKLYPARAAMIRNAHERALHYLAQCQINLQSLRPDVFAQSQFREFFTQLFGDKNLTQALKVRLRESLAMLQTDMLSKAMSPIDSERYVVGIRRRQNENTYAFTHPLERPMRIYFTELFFSPPLGVLGKCLKEPFEVQAHAQALTLIHEQSHISLDSFDIAYADAVMPLYDLVDTQTPIGLHVYNALLDSQIKSLSTLTPEQQLFRVWDSSNDLWDDPDEFLTRTITHLTQASDLAGARALFRTNDAVRVNVLLHNADSLALIVNRLSRKLKLPPVAQWPELPPGGQEIFIG